MDPVCLRIGGLTIYWYGVLLAAAFFVGMANWVILDRNQGRGLSFYSDLLFWLMVSGIVGGRVAYVLSDLRYFLEHPARIIRVDQGGLVFHGGFLAACGAVLVFARMRGLRPVPLLDLIATALPLSHALGRVGCFINGCCYGRPHDGFTSVTYPASSLAWWQHVESGLLPQQAPRALPVHAVQLYETGANLLIYALLVWIYKRRRREGRTAGAYLVSYGLARFFLEFLRGDLRPHLLGLSAAQCVGLGMVAAGLILLGAGVRFSIRPTATGGQTPCTQD